MCVLVPGRIKILKGLIFYVHALLSAYFYALIMVQSLAEDIVSTAWTSICKGLASCFGAFVTFWHGCGETQNAEVGCYFLCVVGGHGGNVSASVILFKLSNFSVKIQLTISPSPKTPPTNATNATHTHTHTSTHKGERCCLASPIALNYKAFEYTPSRRPLRASEAHLTLRRISPTCG